MELINSILVAIFLISHSTAKDTATYPDPSPSASEPTPTTFFTATILPTTLLSSDPSISDLSTSDLPTSDLPTSDLPISDLPTSDLPTSTLSAPTLPPSNPVPDPTTPCNPSCHCAKGNATLPPTPRLLCGWCGPVSGLNGSAINPEDVILCSGSESDSGGGSGCCNYGVLDMRCGIALETIPPDWGFWCDWPVLGLDPEESTTAGMSWGVGSSRTEGVVVTEVPGGTTTTMTTTTGWEEGTSGWETVTTEAAPIQSRMNVPEGMVHVELKIKYTHGPQSMEARGG
ncbi:hypothetical protein BS50DRAFT_640777 [Corynespora cassiicola Philippines]|uniref:CBM1 domain-containing protein n=1 Tax=Corynespora cassiicola Philippines TaxID=1448308 RepID=A0A2T2N2H3_CORCC|nr:hypothetical protein BS50DRAFT_640777 [Corynespora cassiicola Philippines]